jgi:homoserine kinase type II
MAVYTRLSKIEITNLIKNYDIGELISFQEIIAGIDNSNYIITTDQSKFILTIFEERLKNENIEFFINLKNFLAENQIICPKAIKNKSGNITGEIKGKKFAIISFLKGKMLSPNSKGYYPNISIKHCEQLGDQLGKIHRIIPNFQQSRHNDLDINGMEKIFNKFQLQLKILGIKDEIAQYINQCRNINTSNLKKQVIHSDIFPDNVFFDEGDNLSGIIDFYFAGNDFLIYDLAVVINAWCFDGDNFFIPEKENAIIKHYENNRQLTAIEKEIFNNMKLKAALRFFLTRLQDFFNTSEDSLVKVKNPKEYLEKIRYWHNITSIN